MEGIGLLGNNFSHWALAERSDSSLDSQCRTHMNPSKLGSAPFLASITKPYGSPSLSIPMGTVA